MTTMERRALITTLPGGAAVAATGLASLPDQFLSAPLALSLSHSVFPVGTGERGGTSGAGTGRRPLPPKMLVSQKDTRRVLTPVGCRAVVNGPRRPQRLTARNR